MYIIIWCFISSIFVLKSEGQSCFNNVIDIRTGQPVKNVTEYCARTPCVFRFCERLDDILLNVTKELTCLSPKELKSKTNITIQWSDVKQVFKKEGSDLKESAKSFRNDFIHLKYTDDTNFNCTGNTIPNNNIVELHILEDGSLMQHIIVLPNVHVRQPARSFIVEYQIKRKKGKWIGPILTTTELVLEGNKFIDYYKSFGLLISCFFLTVLLVIYGLLRQLRSLAGLILMAHVFTINVGFLLKATHNLTFLFGTVRKTFCLYTSIIMYFSLLSSFFWMNVMSFDIWWTFRGSVRSRDINRRGIIHKFCMYSLYAFGGPLVIVALALVIDEVDPENTIKIVKPGFKSCLLPDSYLQYVYIPFTIMISINVIFFILTSLNIYRLKKLIKNTLKNNPSTKKNENRFILYIKLFLITGINWIFDLVLFLTKPPEWVEYIPDTYNMLIGVVIFAMYICKREILLQICNRFPIFGRFAPMFQPRSSQKTISTKVSENRNNSVVD